MKFGQPVLVAIPLGKYATLPARLLAGKMVIDAMNYNPERDAGLSLGSRTSSEVVAEHLRGARIVKAFNTMSYETLGSRGQPDASLDDRLALFMAGDDVQAKGDAVATDRRDWGSRRSTLGRSGTADGSSSPGPRSTTRR